jgi:phosphotransferase system HPr-like phosphotransfer protein
MRLELGILNEGKGKEIEVIIDGDSEDVQAIFEAIRQLIAKQGWKLE